MLKSQINLKLTEVQLDLVRKLVLVSCLSYRCKFQCPHSIWRYFFRFFYFNNCHSSVISVNLFHVSKVLSATNLHPLLLTECKSFHRILEATDTKFSAIWPCWQSNFDKQKEKATRLIDKKDQQILVLIQPIWLLKISNVNNFTKSPVRFLKVRAASGKLSDVKFQN